MLNVQDDALKSDVGVIVGRFQVPRLHSEHIELIKTVKERHLRTVIFLGTPCTRVTRRDPLEYKLRRQMIADVFPDIDDVYFILDKPDDIQWSKDLDAQIAHHIGDKSAVLYGSRDSFISYYHGRYKTVELVPNKIVSGTELRRVAANISRASEDFRAGIIYAVEQQYSHPWTTVDIAIFNDDMSKILLGRKKTDAPGKMRFIGGFVRTSLNNINTLETNARAEVIEETHLEVSDPVYIGSAVIDDWRYKYDENKIMTTFFAVKRIFGSAQADDDIDYIQWMTISDITENDIAYGHVVLYNMLKKWIAAGNKV